MKQKILQVVEGLPDTATFEDAIERLCFLAKIEEGIRQSDAGETVSHAEAVRQLLT
jgi:predicted transcriptional regulator